VIVVVVPNFRPWEPTSLVLPASSSASDSEMKLSVSTLISSLGGVSETKLVIGVVGVKDAEGEFRGEFRTAKGECTMDEGGR